MARVFSFRGKSLDELQKMSIDDYSRLVTSRERRAIKRMSLSYKQLIEIVAEAKKSGGGKTIKTQLREAVILPSWVGTRFGVHDGKEFKEIVVTPEMLGHRLGEFAYTTKRVQHSAPGIRATRGSKFLAVK
ncbi:MAG: ribosomal protein S19 family protein [Candidatus Micrarchaeota archaeon]|nr:ribosomal protein S19 family protein [Candidatus Micrarchaeota archaeon]